MLTQGRSWGICAQAGSGGRSPSNSRGRKRARKLRQDIPGSPVRLQDILDRLMADSSSDSERHGCPLPYRRARPNCLWREGMAGCHAGQRSVANLKPKSQDRLQCALPRSGKVTNDDRPSQGPKVYKFDARVWPSTSICVCICICICCCYGALCSCSFMRLEVECTI